MICSKSNVFAVKLKYAVKREKCDRKGRLTMLAIAISHRRNGTDTKRGACIYCDMRLRNRDRRNCIGETTEGANT